LGIQGLEVFIFEDKPLKIIVFLIKVKKLGKVKRRCVLETLVKRSSGVCVLVGPFTPATAATQGSVTTTLVTHCEVEKAKLGCNTLTMGMTLTPSQDGDAFQRTCVNFFHLV
jgi:hypothetical protein